MQPEHNINNYGLTILAVIFKVFGLFTVTEAANLLLTGLSIISVTILIVINWDKFIDRLKKK